MSFREFLPFTPEDSNYFQLTLNEMITYSAGLIQVGIDGEGLAAYDYARCVNAANLAILEMQNQGLHLSSYKVGYLFCRRHYFCCLAR